MTMIAWISSTMVKGILIEHLERLTGHVEDRDQKADDRDDHRIVARQERDQHAENT